MGSGSPVVPPAWWGGACWGCLPTTPAKQLQHSRDSGMRCVDPRKALKGLTQISCGPGGRGWKGHWLCWDNVQRPEQR